MTETEQQEYLEKHLPYRINSMLAHDLIHHRLADPSFTYQGMTKSTSQCHHKCYQDSLIIEPVFEVSLIFGRSLLNFIGLSSDWDAKELQVFKPKTHDLTIKSFSKDFCPIDDPIVKENKSSLLLLLKCADKSVAHLTSFISEPVDQNQLPKARAAIYKLLLKHLPEIKKENIWWYTQIEHKRS